MCDRTSTAAAVILMLIGLLAANPARTWGQGELFVLNQQRTITVYGQGASGDTAPARALSVLGPGALLMGIAADAAHAELFVVDAADPSVAVFPIGANVAPPPSRAIRGPGTGLGHPVNLLYDPAHDEIVVLNADPPSITVYDRTASGDVVPKRTIVGPNTGLGSPIGLALDTIHDELIVSDASLAVVNVYSRTAGGDAAPLRVLAADPAGHVVGPVVVDAVNQELLVIRGPGRELAVFARAAAGSAAPLRVLVPRTPEGVSGIALDATANELLLLDPGAGFPAQPAVFRYQRTASGNDAPLRTLAGPSTNLTDPRALTLSTSLPPPTTLAASILPSSRSVQIGKPATA